jgi:hypothetical protein
MDRFLRRSTGQPSAALAVLALCRQASQPPLAFPFLTHKKEGETNADQKYAGKQHELSTEHRQNGGQDTRDHQDDADARHASYLSKMLPAKRDGQGTGPG